MESKKKIDHEKRFDVVSFDPEDNGGTYTVVNSNNSYQVKVKDLKIYVKPITDNNDGKIENTEIKFFNPFELKIEYEPDNLAADEQ